MERRIITFIYALLCFVSLTAQTDKTATILSSNQNDEAKVKSLNKLASDLIEEKFLNEADGVVQKAIEMPTISFKLR